MRRRIQTLITAFVAANPSVENMALLMTAGECGRDRARDEYVDAGVEGRDDLRHSGDRVAARSATG